MKQEKAFERLKQFRGELTEYREQFQRLKSLNDDVVCLKNDLKSPATIRETTIVLKRRLLIVHFAANNSRAN